MIFAGIKVPIMAPNVDKFIYRKVISYQKLKKYQYTCLIDTPGGRWP
jgi:hypothetical protein